MTTLAKMSGIALRIPNSRMPHPLAVSCLNAMPATCGVFTTAVSVQKKRLTRHLNPHGVQDPVSCLLCTRMLKGDDRRIR